MVTADFGSIEGLKNVEVQRQLNHILLTEVERLYLHFLSHLETDPFCKDSVGKQTSVSVVAPLLSETLISMLVHIISDGIHPWYDLRA